MMEPCKAETYRQGTFKEFQVFSTNHIVCETVFTNKKRSKLRATGRQNALLHDGKCRDQQGGHALLNEGLLGISYITLFGN
jgi:hypothetical protein